MGHGNTTTSPARYLPERLNVPGTAFLRVLDEPAVWDNGVSCMPRRAVLGLDALSGRSASASARDGRDGPLAYALEGAPVWDFELSTFMGGESSVKTGLFMLQPYVPGRIPVVFVHGTASSPARWAPMFNGLLADPALRSRCQFWFFIYSTSSPIAMSGRLLRDALRQVGPNLDPEGRDPALSQMVLIGHSQGGLLTRMMVTTSGDAVWNSISPTVPVADFDSRRASWSTSASGDRVLSVTA